MIRPYRPSKQPINQPRIGNILDPLGNDKKWTNVWGAVMNVPQPSGGVPVSPTPTPTASVTPTITPTNTVTPTSTVTPSVTPTNTVTPTPSITPTNTPTPSVTPTLTPSITPTNTVTPTNTTTPTPTPTNPGITITFYSGRTFNNTSSSFTASNMPYGGAGLVIIPILSNGNVSISSVTLGGVAATSVTQYNCSSSNRVSVFQVIMSSGSSGDLVINMSSPITGIDMATYRITNNTNNTSSQVTTICQGSGLANYTLTSLAANSVGVYATINGTPSCDGTILNYNSSLGSICSFKQVAAGTRTCPVSFGGIVSGVARTWK